MNRSTLILFFCAALILNAIASQVEEEVPVASPEHDEVEDGCFDQEALEKFINGIRENEIRLNRLFGAHACVKRRFQTLPPERAFVHNDELIKCYEADLVVGAVIECAKQVEGIRMNY